jgi:lysophospholipase L1-like esterase
MKYLRNARLPLLGRRIIDPEAHWDLRVKAFRNEGRRLAVSDERRWVLLGDSLVEGFPSAFLRAVDKRWLNRGIASDHLGGGARSMLARLGHDTLAPAPASLLIAGGINDLGDQPDQPERVVKRLAALVAEAKLRHPRTRLVLQSLLPTRGEYAHLNPAIRALNVAIVRLAQAEGAVYLDVHRLLVDDAGALRRVFSRDGLHLRLPAYVLWAYALLRLENP